MIFQAIIWITELCEVLTKTQMDAVQPNADVDALSAEQQKFENTAQVRNMAYANRNGCLLPNGTKLHGG